MHPYVQGIQDKVNKNEVIKQLLSLLAEEFISAFNYKMQAKVIQGFHKEDIRKEFLKHVQEENHHADLLIERILELGGNPEIRPLDWDKHSKCKYIPTTSNDQITLLEDAIQGERCAVRHYTEVINFLKSKDLTTYDLIHRILNDEYNHIKDLSKLLKYVQDSLPQNSEVAEEEVEEFVDSSREPERKSDG